MDACASTVCPFQVTGPSRLGSDGQRERLSELGPGNRSSILCGEVEAMQNDIEEIQRQLTEFETENPNVTVTENDDGTIDFRWDALAGPASLRWDPEGGQSLGEVLNAIRSRK